MSSSKTIKLVESHVDKKEATDIFYSWGQQNQHTLNLKSTATIYYPFYYGETYVVIKRIFPLSPRELRHRWMVDSITGRPFMLSDPPLVHSTTLSPEQEIMEPVIYDTVSRNDMEEKTLRFVMRFYKYFFTPHITVENFDLIYIKVWLFRFRKDQEVKDNFIGVNSWSGDLLEMEDHSLKK